MRSLKLRTTCLFIITSLLGLELGGCVSPVSGGRGYYANPIGDAPVISNATPYSKALICLAKYAQHYNVQPPRMAVGRIIDYTGKADETGGRAITQGASLMAMSALAKAGVPLVERYDTSVAELELKYSNNKLISDAAPSASPNVSNSGNPANPSYRHIYSGQIPGSDFYIVGGITELNYNIRSSGGNLSGGRQNITSGVGILSGRLYVMNVAIDLRLVETKTQDVVDVISYQKQLIGREVGAGLFEFFGKNVIDASVGEGAVEPMQLAVRSLIERGVVEMVANLYGAPGPNVCMIDDPLGGKTSGTTGSFYPAYDNLENNNAATRGVPNRWNAQRDSVIRATPPKTQPASTPPYAQAGSLNVTVSGYPVAGQNANGYGSYGSSTPSPYNYPPASAYPVPAYGANMAPAQTYPAQPYIAPQAPGVYPQQTPYPQQNAPSYPAAAYGAPAYSATTTSNYSSTTTAYPVPSAPLPNYSNQNPNYNNPNPSYNNPNTPINNPGYNSTNASVNNQATATPYQVPQPSYNGAYAAPNYSPQRR